MLSIDQAQKDIQHLMQTVNLYQHRSPLFRRLGRALVNDTKMNFARTHGPDGTPWAELKHRSGRALSDTGRLKNSINFAVGKDEVEYGTNVRYAIVHQEGRVIKPVKAKALRFIGLNGPVFAKQVTIPARPFMGIEERQIHLIQRAIERWAIEVANRGSRNVH